MKPRLDFGWNDVRDMTVTPDALARKITRKILPRSEREVYLAEIARQDIYMASAGVDGYTPPHDDKTYRVSIFPDGIDIICFGLDSIDSNLEGHYDHVDDLPNWVQERIAVLSMIPATPPTKEVEGIGRRISKHVYWVYSPDTAPTSTSV